MLFLHKRFYSFLLNVLLKTENNGNRFVLIETTLRETGNTMFVKN